jgi:hypothetical protein
MTEKGKFNMGSVTSEQFASAAVSTHAVYSTTKFLEIIIQIFN